MAYTGTVWCQLRRVRPGCPGAAELACDPGVLRRQRRPSRNLIQFTGTAAAAQAAFGTHFGRFQRNGQTFFSNTSGPTIPSAFRDVISGVQGLNSYRLQPHLLKHVFSAAELQARQTPALTGTNLSGVTVHELVPYDVRQIYNANSLVSSGYTGTGVTIAVIGQTGVNLTSSPPSRRSPARR